MRIQTLRAMLARRGYTLLQKESNWCYSPGVIVLRQTLFGGAGSRVTVLMAEDELEKMSMEDARKEIDRQLAWGGTNHHMQCGTCQEPVIRLIGGTNKEDGSTQWYEFCTVPGGPHSLRIAHCLRCDSELAVSAVEIQDR